MSNPQPTPTPQVVYRMVISRYQAVGYALLCLLVLSPLLIRAWCLWSIPDIPVPFDEAEFLNVQIPEEQNAWGDYQRAFRLRESIEESLSAKGKSFPSEEFGAVWQNGWNVATEDCRAWMDELRPAMLVWKSATQKQASFDAEVVDPNHYDSSHYRAFARLACYEARRLETENHHVDAAGWYVAAVRSSHHLCNHSPVIRRLVGSAISDMALDGLAHWSETSNLTSAELRLVLNELVDANKMSRPLSETLKADRILNGRYTIQANWWMAISMGNDPFESLSAYEDYPFASSATYGLIWTLGEPELSRRALAHALSNQLLEIDKPLTDRRPAANTNSKELLFALGPNQNGLAPETIDRALQFSMPARLFTTYSKQLDQFTHFWQSRTVVIQIVLAIQAYQRDHGEFPDGPLSIVPAYLDDWPQDPWDSTGRPMRYRRTDGGTAIVWSVGLDGIDGDGDFAQEEFGYSSPDIGLRLKTR